MKKGQKFIVEFTRGPETLTATGFFQKSGKEYNTAEEAAKENGCKILEVLVKNKEYGGASMVKDCDFIYN